MKSITKTVGIALSEEEKETLSNAADIVARLAAFVGSKYDLIAVGNSYDVNGLHKLAQTIDSFAGAILLLNDRQ